MGMFKLKDIQARLDILSSTKNVELLNGDLLYKYTFDTVSFNTYNYDGIEIITFFVHDNKYIEVTYKYLNAIMTKAINIVKYKDTDDEGYKQYLTAYMEGLKKQYTFGRNLRVQAMNDCDIFMKELKCCEFIKKD